MSGILFLVTVGEPVLDSYNIQDLSYCYPLLTIRSSGIITKNSSEEEIITKTEDSFSKSIYEMLQIFALSEACALRMSDQCNTESDIILIHKKW